MLQAPVGKGHVSDVDKTEVSDEEGRAVISPAPASTDVDGAYKVVLEAVGQVCAVYDVVCKDVMDNHKNNTDFFAREGRPVLYIPLLRCQGGPEHVLRGRSCIHED